MRIRPFVRLLYAAAVAAPLFWTGCESTEESVLPARILIESGNGQQSKKGTALPDPLVVRVQYPDLSNASGFVVRFTVIQGGGVLSSSTDVTDGRGLASVRYTLGPDTGTNRIRAEVTGDVELSVEFTETSGDYFCPEEDPTFTEKFPPGGPIENDLFLFTRQSRLNTSGGAPTAGIVRLQVTGLLRPVAFTSFEEGIGRIPTLDCAFSANGDFYLAWQDVFNEVVKVRPNGRAEHFAALETVFGGEITATPTGVLVGCDMYGPFVVGCRDTLQRFSEALYSGDPGDQANGDAVAVDPNPQSPWYEDIYFIDLSDRTLRRLPVDSLVAQGPTVVVAQLSSAEAHGARGMECNDDGTVYILVDDDDGTVKSILEVTPTGTKTTVFDFFTRGSGSEEDAGMMSDLAIRRGGNPILYTVDTWHDMLLRYDVGQQVLSEMFPDTTQGYDPEGVSVRGPNGMPAGGERVGLVVIPSS